MRTSRLPLDPWHGSVTIPVNSFLMSVSHGKAFEWLAPHRGLALGGYVIYRYISHGLARAVLRLPG